MINVPLAPFAGRLRSLVMLVFAVLAFLKSSKSSAATSVATASASALSPLSPPSPLSPLSPPFPLSPLSPLSSVSTTVTSNSLVTEKPFLLRVSVRVTRVELSGTLTVPSLATTAVSLLDHEADTPLCVVS